MRRSSKTAYRDRVARCDVLFHRAKEAHRAGNRESARQLYQLVLANLPRHADASHLLGFAEFQSGLFESSITHLERAVELRPENGEFQHNLGLAYLATGGTERALRQANEALRLGYCDPQSYLHVGWELFQRRQFDLAETAYRLALAANPDLAEPFNDLGVLFAAQHRWGEAVACYQRALQRSPRMVEALNNLGNAFRDQQRMAEAIPCYEQALAHDPRFAAAHNNLGVALAQLGQIEAAILCYERAVQFDPDSVEPLNNLGNAWRDLGRTNDAVACFLQALRSRPVSAEILCNLAASWQQQGKLPEAVAALRQAVMLQPKSAKMHLQLASVLADMGQFSAAGRCCDHLIRLEPDQPLWRLRRAALCPMVFTSREEMEAAREDMSTVIDEVGRLDFRVPLHQLAETAPSFPFAWQFLDGNLRGIKTAYADVFHQRIDTSGLKTPVDSWTGPRSRPRLGFVVTNGHEGVFLRSLRDILNRLSSDWEPLVLCSIAGSTRIRTAFPEERVQIVPLPTRFDQAARRIADTRCDLLYYWEVGTDVTNYFLPFLRLAPVQMLSWGSQLTSGIPNVDAYLSSELIEPEHADDHYSERLMLARTLLTYCHRAQLPAEPRSRESFPIPSDANWYVCAQQLGKFHVDFDPMLERILSTDPRGALVITGDRYGRFAERLRQRFETSMPGVADRIFILSRLGQADYLSLLLHANVLLDAPHFSGANSTYDSLSLGKPVVTLPSPFQRGRYTLGCYRQMKLLDCVAKDADDYCELAVRIATAADYRHHLSQRIREASHVLFEDAAVVSEHERVFAELISRRALAPV
jgi:tetratricopeptide (TPR) repeat protein